MLEAVADGRAADQLAVHFHDTYGQALANILASLEGGLRGRLFGRRDSAAVPTPRVRRATSPARTSSTCCMGSASRPGVDLDGSGPRTGSVDLLGPGPWANASKVGQALKAKAA